MSQINHLKLIYLTYYQMLIATKKSLRLVLTAFFKYLDNNR